MVILAYRWTYVRTLTYTSSLSHCLTLPRWFPCVQVDILGLLLKFRPFFCKSASTHLKSGIPMSMFMSMFSCDTCSCHDKGSEMIVTVDTVLEAADAVCTLLMLYVPCITTPCFWAAPVIRKWQLVVYDLI